MNEIGYRKLIAWQKANLLAHFIYDVTIKFPKEEMFGIISQMRRAVLSVCANIAEGYSRSSRKDRKHFYLMAISSLTELEFFIDFSFERKYINESDYEKIVALRHETGRVLNGLTKST
jgi:four helix bundle protein